MRDYLHQSEIDKLLTAAKVSPRYGAQTPFKASWQRCCYPRSQRRPERGNQREAPIRSPNGKHSTPSDFECRTRD
jgi:hypothetical protein